jgi:hypothetical protein
MIQIILFSFSGCRSPLDARAVGVVQISSASRKEFDGVAWFVCASQEALPSQG